MKILLLGEFSGLHKNLKEGLQKLGHDVFIASHGDSWKNIERDIDLTCTLPDILKMRKIGYRCKILSKFPLFCNYDVVQLINPFYFYMRYFPVDLFIDAIHSMNKKFFLAAAGDDSFFWRYGRYRLRYAPFDDFLKYDIKQQDYYMASCKAFDFNMKIIQKIRKIIPVMYEYEISYRDINKLLPAIPIPINTDKIDYTPNFINNKIVIFHGLNRYGFKGTRHIQEAFEILKKRYPNDLELIIDGKMSIDKYLSVIRRANIMVDQTYSYSCGMNAIYSLAMAKIVLGGAEPESLVSLGVTESPVINILPNAQDIVMKIENILEKRNDFEELGYKSRKFAEEVHGYVKVARQYIDAWSSS